MRNFITLILVIILLGQTNISFPQKTKYTYPEKDWDQWFSFEDAGYDPIAMTSIRRFIIDSMNTTGVVVVVEGKVLATYGDIQELSYLASCRKSILAMLYGIYIEYAEIDLEKTLEELEMEDNLGLLPVEKKATVHHLITARSGVYHPASNAGDNSADAPERGSQEPGTYFLYNNWDFNAAGAAFEKLTGIDIYDALDMGLAMPIGMQDFDRLAQHKSGNLMRSRYPAYHIWLSTRDMARIGYLMLRKGNWDGEQVISKDWAEKIVTVVTPTEEMNPDYMRNGDFGYGYMWWVWDGEAAIGAFEGAYTARGAYGQYITVLPALDMVVAHKTKAEYGRRTSWSNYEKVLKKLVDAKLD